MRRSTFQGTAGLLGLVACLGLAFVGTLALADDKPENLSLKQQLTKVVAELEKAKKAADNVPDVPFPFGHFLATKDEGPAPIILQTAAPTAPASETPSVQINVSGVVGAEGNYRVLLNGDTFSEGDAVPNVGKVVKITESTVTIQTNDGKTITKKVP